MTPDILSRVHIEKAQPVDAPGVFARYLSSGHEPLVTVNVEARLVLFVYVEHVEAQSAERESA